jgi:hypothetical protein
VLFRLPWGEQNAERFGGPAGLACDAPEAGWPCGDHLRPGVALDRQGGAARLSPAMRFLPPRVRALPPVVEAALLMSSARPASRCRTG